MLQMTNVYPEVDLRVMIDNTGGVILKTEVEVEKKIVETKVVIDREIDKEIEVVISREIEAVIDTGIGAVKN